MLGSEGVKADDGISERSCCPYMLPGESGQTRLWELAKSQRIASSLVGWRRGNLLHSGVIGVLTGLTRTLSRWIFDVA